MSDGHLFVIVVFSVFCAMFLSQLGTCRYLQMYAQLMPGRMDEELKNAKLSNGALAILCGIITTVAIFWK
jgi:uncharacterized membrane protein YidH (DUF202 family)